MAAAAGGQTRRFVFGLRGSARFGGGGGGGSHRRPVAAPPFARVSIRTVLYENNNIYKKKKKKTIDLTRVRDRNEECVVGRGREEMEETE